MRAIDCVISSSLLFKSLQLFTRFTDFNLEKRVECVHTLAAIS